MIRMSSLGAAVITVSVIVMSHPALSAPDASTGEALAKSACAYCHVVAPDQGFAPISRPQGPDFAVIAANAKNTAGRLRMFLMTTHQNVGKSSAGMPNPLLTNDQIADIVSYILSLRTGS